jgi:CubicO group peptidase (beta-lactamase class C family)
MKKLIVLLSSLSAALMIGACSASSTDPQMKNTPTFDKAAMDNLLSGAVKAGDVIGVSALVFDEGQTVYKGVFGLGDRERGTALTEDSVFRIYSMTKPITSVVIMDLIEEGKISLDDPVSKFIPELGTMKVASLAEDGMPQFTEPKTPMTVKHLLLHKAGLGYGIFGPVNPVEEAYMNAGLFEPSEDLSVKMTKLSQLPLLVEPDTAWFYSYSIDVLGRIIEVVTEQRLGDVFKTRIFDPLGMSETSFGVREDQVARFVSNYAYNPETNEFTLAEDGQTSPFIGDNAFQSGGGGLVSTLGDYAKFAQMMLDGGVYKGHRVLETETVKTMMTNQMNEADAYLLPWIGGETGAGFGYGGSVQVTATDAQALEKGRHPGQWGWSGAARTVFYVDPQNEAFGIIMLQMFSAEDPQIHFDFKALALAQTRDEIQD